nr:hypothetical protein [Chlamydiota bacterium]
MFECMKTSNNNAVPTVNTSAKGLAPINTLPDELIFHIFSYLTTRELGRCGVVNKKWKDFT